MSGTTKNESFAKYRRATNLETQVERGRTMLEMEVGRGVLIKGQMKALINLKTRKQVLQGSSQMHTEKRQMEGCCQKI